MSTRPADELGFRVAHVRGAMIWRAVLVGVSFNALSQEVQASDLDYSGIETCIADTLTDVNVAENQEYQLLYSSDGEIDRVIQTKGARLPSSPTSRHLHRRLWEAFTICAPLNPTPEMLAGMTAVTFNSSGVSVVANSMFEPDLAKTDGGEIELSRRERRRVQRYLMFLGYDPGSPDGVFGVGTRTAISAWQAAEGFPETGEIDERQYKRLESRAAGLYANWVQEMATK